MGKKKGRNKGQRNHRVKMWSDLTGKPTRVKKVFPNHMSADFVKPKGGINKGLHYDLNRSHMNSLTKNQMLFKEDEEGEFYQIISKNESVPITQYSPEQLIAESFVIPRLEAQRLKRNIILNNGEIRKELWHEIILQEDEYRKLSLCFYARTAVFVEVYKTTRTLAVTTAFTSTTKAMERYKTIGFRGLPWGQHRPYKNST